MAQQVSTKSTFQFLAILSTAIAMSGGWAHLLALPNKMLLDANEYLIAQQVYTGWALLGLVIFAALGLTIALVSMQRSAGGPAFRLTVVAAICIALSLVVFFAFTFPTNQATENWTTLPENWESLRNQWEYSHAAGAILYLVALGSLVLSVMTERSRQ